MPRTNYMVAWHNLKDIIAAAARAGANTLDTRTLLCLIFNLEHPGLEWDKLDKILEALETAHKE